MNRRAGLLLLVPCLLLSLLLGACAPEALVEVTVSGSEGLSRLIASGALIDASGQARALAPANLTVEQRLDRFVLRLPADAVGTLRVAVTGLVDGCQSAAGTGSVPVQGPGAYAVTVVLATDPVPGCTLQVVVGGRGSVSATTPGIIDGCTYLAPCAARLRPGDQVTLVAQPVQDAADPQAGTYFFDWANGCTGGGACTITIGSGVTRVSARFVERRVCSADRFCWVQPRPVGTTINGVWGMNNGEVFAVGDEATILHYDGAALSAYSLQASLSLRGIWSDGERDTWIVGAAGTILHLNSGVARIVPGGTSLLSGVWGVPMAQPGLPPQVWICGAQGTVLRQEGDGFVRQAPPLGDNDLLLSIWGSGPQDVWTVGVRDDTQGVLWHFDGVRWSAPSPPSGAALPWLWAVWGSAADDVWIAGEEGTLLHWDGATLRRAPFPEPTEALHRIFGTGRGDVWVAGGLGAYHIGDDQVPRHYYTGSNSVLFGLWGDRPDDYWAVGTGGALTHWNGANWQALSTGSLYSLNSAFSPATDDLWAVGAYGVILHSSGTSGNDFSSVPEGNLMLGAYHGVWGSAANNVWMVGDGGRVSRWNGLRMSANILDAGVGDLRGVWGSGDQELWMAGGPRSTSAPTDPDGKTTGTLLHWRWDAPSQSWNIDSYSGITALLRAVWGSRSQDVWAVGGSRDASGALAPRIIHASGAQVVPVPAPAGEYILTAVWGSGPSDVWAGGGVPDSRQVKGAGVLLHWDGSAWQRVDAPALGRLITSLSGTGPADAWATTEAGEVWRWNGGSWTRLDGGSDLPLYGVWVGGAAPAVRDVWVVGATGSILRRRGD